MRIATALLVAVTVSGTPFHEQTASADCMSLKLMSRMARIVAWEHRDVVDEVMRDACDANGIKSTRTWPGTAQSMKRSNGTWYYPENGGRAIDRYSLYYPGDKQAKVDDKWYYPDDGDRARDEPSKKRPWHLPVGTSTTTEQGLIDWACPKGRGVSERCNKARADIGAVSGDERVLAVIELAWSARNAGQK
jgi:hypothetical protein